MQDKTFTKILSRIFARPTQRYAILAAIFGLSFPIVATLVRIAISKMPFEIASFIYIQFSDPILWIVYTAPIVLGLFAAFAGRREEALEQLNVKLQLREKDLNFSRENLEQRILERTATLEQRSAELETLAEVARDISSYRNLETLLSVTVDLIRERFSFYHVGIFIVDDRNEYAILRAASGIAGQQMLENHYKLRVGETGVVGYATSTGQSRIMLDADTDSSYIQNPFLPNTKSEIALPLRSRNLVIGALDIQSREPNAFNDQTIKIFLLLADQLVSAIENLQLVTQVETTLKELNTAYQTQTQQAWQRTFKESKETAVEYDGLQIKPVHHGISPWALDKLQSGKAIVTTTEYIGGDKADKEQKNNTLLVPLMVLNQIVGVIGLEQDDPNYKWTDEEMAVAEAAANRAALSLENARLLEESQKRVVIERTTSDISTRISSSTHFETILQTAAEELSRALDGSDVFVQIDPASMKLNQPPSIGNLI